MTAIHVSQ